MYSVVVVLALATEGLAPNLIVPEPVEGLVSTLKLLLEKLILRD